MNKPADLEFEVVVVGGGVSGFSAAYTIAQKDPGLSVLLLEETGKIGGNTLSNCPTIELISNSSQYLMHILRKLNLEPVKRKSNGMAVGELSPGKVLYSDEDVPLFCSYFEKKKFEYFLSKIEILCEQVSLTTPIGSLESESLDNTSMEDYICENITSEEMRNYMRTIVHTNCGVQPKDMSALFYIAYCHSTGGIKNQLDRSFAGSTGFIFENGREQICNTIKQLEIFQVNLNERAKSIWREYSSISVITDQKRYKCLHVIVALSPDKILLLDIRPILVEKRHNILNEMTYNMLETTVVNRNMPKHFSGDIICAVEENNSIERAVDINNVKPNGLFVYLYSNDEEKIQRQLNRYFNCCGDEEYANGDKNEYHNYKICCVPGMNTLKYLHEIRRPLFRLFWAGSHTSTISYGHLEGSVYSGMRAAIELLYDYKPQVLSRQDIIFLTNQTSPVSVFKHTKFNNLVRQRGLYYKLMFLTTFIIMFGVYRKLRK